MRKIGIAFWASGEVKGGSRYLVAAFAYAAAQNVKEEKRKKLKYEIYGATWLPSTERNAALLLGLSSFSTKNWPYFREGGSFIRKYTLGPFEKRGNREKRAFLTHVPIIRRPLLFAVLPTAPLLRGVTG